jgi:hypothetical protein
VKILDVLLDCVVDAEPTAFGFRVDGRLRNDPPFAVPQPAFLFLQLVQRNHEIPLNPILRNQELSRFLETGTAQK